MTSHFLVFILWNIILVYIDTNYLGFAYAAKLSKLSDDILLKLSQYNN